MVKFQKLDCELCTTQFPFKIVYQNRIVDIVGVEKPEKNYIILESLSNEQHKIFHIIDTTTIQTVNERRHGKNKILIGRGQDSDVRVVDDISVSRPHAFI